MRNRIWSLMFLSCTHFLCRIFATFYHNGQCPMTTFKRNEVPDEMAQFYSFDNYDHWDRFYLFLLMNSKV